MSSRRSRIAFEMLPLWATAKPPDGELGEQRLDVAQRRSRRWSNSGHGRSRRGRRARGSRRPCRNCRRHGPCRDGCGSRVPSKLVMPAASWPRCWSACRPSATIAAALSAPQMPNTPHSSRSLSSSKGWVVSITDPVHAAVGSAYRHAPRRFVAPGESGQALLTRRLDVDVNVNYRRAMPETALHSDYRQPRARSAPIRSPSFATNSASPPGRCASTRTRG